MVLALALAAVLAADEPEAQWEQPPPPATAPAIEPRAPEPDPQQLEAEANDRLIRIGVTLAGGAAGIALPLLLGWAGQAASGSCPVMFGCSADGPMAIAASALPLTVGTGLGVGHYVRGGKAGVGFGLAGGLSGYMVSTLVLALVSGVGNKDWTKTIPAAGGAIIATFSLLGAVTALELRHSELEGGARPWSLGRSIASGVAFWLPATLVEAGVLFLASQFTCCTSDVTVPIAIGTIGTALNLAMGALAGWGAHRALDGKGEYWAALVGGLVSAGAAVAFGLVHAHAPPDGGAYPTALRTPYSMVPVLAFAFMIAAVGPSAALEWSNARSEDAIESKEPGIDNVQVNGGFGPNGATLGLSGTF